MCHLTLRPRTPGDRSLPRPALVLRRVGSKFVVRAGGLPYLFGNFPETCGSDMVYGAPILLVSDPSCVKCFLQRGYALDSTYHHILGVWIREVGIPRRAWTTPGSGGIRRVVPGRGGLCPVSGATSMAGRLHLSWMRREGGAMAGVSGAPCLPGLPKTGERDRGDPVPPLPQAPEAVVPGGLGDHQPEVRGKRPGPATRAGAGQLPYGLGVAPQVSSRHGPAGSEQAERTRRSR